jgi:hypothetical protein
MSLPSAMNLTVLHRERQRNPAGEAAPAPGAQKTNSGASVRKLCFEAFKIAFGL